MMPRPRPHRPSRQMRQRCPMPMLLRWATVLCPLPCFPAGPLHPAAPPRRPVPRYLPVQPSRLCRGQSPDCRFRLLSRLPLWVVSVARRLRLSSPVGVVVSCFPRVASSLPSCFALLRPCSMTVARGRMPRSMTAVWLRARLLPSPLTPLMLAPVTSPRLRMMPKVLLLGFRVRGHLTMMVQTDWATCRLSSTATNCRRPSMVRSQSADRSLILPARSISSLTVAMAFTTITSTLTISALSGRVASSFIGLTEKTFF